MHCVICAKKWHSIDSLVFAFFWVKIPSNATSCIEHEVSVIQKLMSGNEQKRVKLRNNLTLLCRYACINGIIIGHAVSNLQLFACRPEMQMCRLWKRRQKLSLSVIIHFLLQHFHVGVLSEIKYIMQQTQSFPLQGSDKVRRSWTDGDLHARAAI